MRSSISKPHNAYVTVIIPVWNSGDYLHDCLNSLKYQSFQDFSIVIVDNGSTDGSIDCIDFESHDGLQVISFPTNKGFAAAVNEGIRQVTGKYIALLNVDVIAAPDWIQELVCEMDKCPDDTGALASGMVRMENPEIVDDAGDIFSWYGSALKRGHGKPVKEYNQQEEVFSVCAGAALYRKDFFDMVGLFDEKFTSYLEDIDLCLRGRLFGYKYLYVPSAKVQHKGHSAGLTHNYYIFLMTRNRLMIFLKNIPFRLFIRHLHQIVYGQIYYFLVYRKPITSLRALYSLILHIPHIIRSRKKILAEINELSSLTDNLLSNELGEPTLLDILKRKLRL